MSVPLKKPIEQSKGADIAAAMHAIVSTPEGAPNPYDSNSLSQVLRRMQALGGGALNEADLFP